MVTSRWPRTGCPVLPMRFREAWASEVLPVAVTRPAGLPRGTTYADLTDAVWEWVDSAAVRTLATHLRQLVHRRIATQPDSPLANAAILAQEWPSGVEPHQVPFAARTRNVLDRLGRVADAEWMRSVTPAELMRPHQSGPVVLLDFGTVIEGMLSATIDGRRVTRAEALRLVGELGAEFPIDKIPCVDPRLDLPLTGETIGAALDGDGPAGALIVHDLVSAAGAVKAALGRISAMEAQDALRDLASAVLRNPHVEAVVRRVGWDGRGGCTLMEAAAEAGVSWQRIHQLERRLWDGLRGRYWFLPVDVAAATP